MDATQLGEGANGPSQPRTHRLLLALLIVGAGFVLGILYLLFHSQKSMAPSNQNHAPSSITTQSPATKVQLKHIAIGLPHPTGIVATNNTTDRRLFVLDQTGYIRIIQADGVTASKPFLDLHNQIHFSSEMGLLGMAFSPHYASDGKFYLNYIDRDQNTIIAAYHVSANPDIADATSGKVLLKLKQPYSNHNGGGLAFGPDGYLYASLGDGGSAGDPQNRAQNLGVLFGKLLRLDVSQVPYKTPTSNPFVGQGGKAGEIWDYGLRNPWRFSFDRKTHDLYIADVGQNKTEEIDVEPAGNKGGNNYGWRCFEANDDYNPAGCGERAAYTFPVVTYGHDIGCSITGGYVYHGSRFPLLEGKYFYSDYCKGNVYWAAKQNDKWQTTRVLETPYQVSTFGEDSSGELYLADYNTGSIYQLQSISQ